MARTRRWVASFALDYSYSGCGRAPVGGPHSGITCAVSSCTTSLRHKTVPSLVAAVLACACAATPPDAAPRVASDRVSAASDVDAAIGGFNLEEEIFAVDSTLRGLKLQHDPHYGLVIFVDDHKLDKVVSQGRRAASGGACTSRSGSKRWLS
jgi:hypothetical protein